MRDASDEFMKRLEENIPKVEELIQLRDSLDCTSFMFNQALYRFARIRKEMKYHMKSFKVENSRFFHFSDKEKEKNG